MKHLLLYLLLLTCSATLSAQAPQMLNYQGVARSTNGSPLSNQSIKLRLSIQPANGNPFYVETHNVTTNQFGLYAVQIGQGAVVNGNFANISWAQNTTFLQVEMDPAGGNNFTQVGTPTQLISVPYALEAQHAASTSLGGDVTGSSNTNKVTAIQNRPVGNAAPATGDVLKWNGSQWQPGTDATSGGGSYSAGNGISISGNVISNNGDLSNTNEIQTLSVNGPNLSLSNGGGTVTLPTGGAVYDEGIGIEINGNTISNAGDLDNFNELQTINLSGNTLTLSDGGGSVTLPTGVNYDEGVGIEINGNTISNAGDLDNTNELQSISLIGNVLTLSDGGGSVTLPTGGGGTNYWEAAGGNDIINNNGGTIFTGGQSIPYQSIFASVNNNSQTIVAQQNGSGTALYAEASGGGKAIITNGDVDVNGVLTAQNQAHFPSGVLIGTVERIEDGGNYEFSFDGTLRSKVDGGDNLGTSSFRFNSVYATNGVINTSDSTLKRNIMPLGYGLEQVMKLAPVSYQWVDGRPGEGRYMGFLAQDLKKVIPEVVRDKEWIWENEEKRTGSWQPAAKLGVAYTEVIPVLTKAIQEQQTMIEALHAKNEMLEKKVAHYETLEKDLAELRAAVMALQNSAGNK